jgi:hypothetical protein
MNRNGTIATLLTLALGTGIASAQYYYQPAPRPAYANTWEAPPPEFVAAQQRGYRDGIEGARKDFQNHRQPNVMNRDEYRNPHTIPAPDRRDYLAGFQRGYDVAVRHMYGYR